MNTTTEQTFGGGTTLHDAILEGIAQARALGLTKDADLSFAIQVAIDKAGLKVSRASKKKE
jgi:hypothetical protein